MLPLLLLMLPAAAAAVGSGECEHSTLLQKNLASLKALKVTEAPALFAAKGLNMTTAKDTLQMAAKNVSEAVKNAQATLEAKELNIDTLESFKSDSTHELEKVFEAMKVQLRKGIEQLQPALKALNLSSSATSLQNMSETAEKQEMPKEVTSCLTLVKGCAMSCPTRDYSKEATLAKLEETRAKIAALKARRNSFLQERGTSAVPGAPAIASASGAFVAGNTQAPLAQSALPDVSPRPPSFDSAWRMESKDLHSLHVVPPAEPYVNQTLTLPDTPVPPTQEAGGKEGDTPPLSQGGQPQGQDGPGVGDQLQAQDGGQGVGDNVIDLTKGEGGKDRPTAVAGDGDDGVPLGYSPGSPVPSSVVPSTAHAAESAESENKFDKYYHQIRRYCDPKYKTQVKASKEVLQLYNTDEGRDKLRALLKTHGSFKSVEAEVARWHTELKRVGQHGKWVTKTYLREKENYTAQMADRSFAWAEKRGLLRTNQVHGEQEARLVLEDFFQHTSETGESTNLRAQGTLEDVDGGMLESQFAGEDANAAVPESAEDRVKQAAVVAAAGKSKLVFPTIQRNDSPFAVLPTFINVLGKKVDSATDTKDRLIAMKIPRATEMAKEMEKLLTSLNSLYGKLSAKQADYLAMDTSKPESLEAKKNEVMGLFAQCTKDDVTLNNYLTRSKNIKKPTESVAAKKSLKRNPPSGEVAKAKKAKK